MYYIMNRLYRYLLLFLLINISIIIVILPFTFEENIFINKPIENEDVILHRSKSSYNLGDLLSIHILRGISMGIHTEYHQNVKDYLVIISHKRNYTTRYYVIIIYIIKEYYDE